GAPIPSSKRFGFTDGPSLHATDKIVAPGRSPLTPRSLRHMSEHDTQTAPDPPHSGARRFGLVWRLWGNRWLRLGMVTALVLLVVAPFAVPWLVYRSTHSLTDDAFVETHVVNIAPQEVSGHLVRYLVQEHDVVAAGQLLAEIDPVPYREQVALLEAK